MQELNYKKKKKVFEKLDNKMLESIYTRFLKIRDGKSRYLRTIKCVKNQDQKILIQDEEIEEI